MSRERITNQLSLRAITIQELVYSQVSVSVYKGYFQQFQAATKVLALPKNVDYRQLEQECAMMMAVSHPSLLRLYDAFWVQGPESYYYVIVTEWCSKDLSKDMGDRRRNQFLWQESELIDMTKDLVEALAYLQGKGIAHRDIKPENLFLSAEKKVKIGDFGSAKWINESLEFATLRGTPLFLSPKLRAALVTNQPQVKHNMFKSDVFSLGLTLLTIARLNFPMELASITVTDDSVERIISSLSYSETLKVILRKMLKIDENHRWDFLEIHKCLSSTGDVPYLPEPRMQPALSEIQVRAVAEREQRTGSEVHSTGFKIVEQVDGMEDKKIPESTKCLKCKKTVNKWDYEAPCQVVQLFCDPQHHMFCSIACFRKFEKENIHPIRCPACHTDIEENTILHYRTSSSRACSVRNSRNESCNVSRLSENTAHSAGSKSFFSWWINFFRCCQQKQS